MKKLIFFFCLAFWSSGFSADKDSLGIGKAKAEMQIAETFLEAGWGFVEETANGTEDIWRILLEGRAYPRLWREAAEQ